MSAAYNFPVTCDEVAYPVAFVNAKPVAYEVAAGLNPKSPVIAEVAIFVIVVLARITKSPAAPRITGASAEPLLPTVVVKLFTTLATRARPAKSLAPVVIVAVYTVFTASISDGVNVAVFPEYETTPETATA